MHIRTYMYLCLVSTIFRVIEILLWLLNELKYETGSHCNLIGIYYYDMLTLHLLEYKCMLLSNSNLLFYAVSTH